MPNLKNSVPNHSSLLYIETHCLLSGINQPRWDETTIDSHMIPWLRLKFLVKFSTGFSWYCSSNGKIICWTKQILRLQLPHNVVYPLIPSYEIQIFYWTIFFTWNIRADNQRTARHLLNILDFRQNFKVTFMKLSNWFLISFF